MHKYKVTLKETPTKEKLASLLMTASRFYASDLVIEVDGEETTYAVKEYTKDGKEVLRD